MKFKIAKTPFLEALQMLKDAADPKSGKGLLRCYKVTATGGKVAISATDLTVEATIKLDCEILEDGECCLPGDKLAAFVSALQDGVVDFSVDSKYTAKISNGTRSYRLAGLKSEGFPESKKKVPVAASWTMAANDLRRVVGAVEHARCVDDSRMSLMGVLLHAEKCELTAVATDGKRLAKITTKIELSPDSSGEVVLPIRPSKVLTGIIANHGLESIAVDIGGGYMTVKGEGWIFRTKVIDQKYPNYKQVIPNGWRTEFSIEKSDMISEIKSASVASIVVEKSDFRSVTIKIANGVMQILAETGSLADSKTSLPVKYDGEYEALFNPDFLTASLAAVPSDTVVIRMNGDSNPIGFFGASDDSFIGILMPLRINK